MEMNMHVDESALRLGDPHRQRREHEGALQQISSHRAVVFLNSCTAPFLTHDPPWTSSPRTEAWACALRCVGSGGAWTIQRADVGRNAPSASGSATRC